MATPVYLTSAPGDLSRLFVVERDGVIRVIKNGLVRARPFLNLSTSVSTANGGGLYSLVFHPNYPGNGFFYVYYTNNEGKPKLRRFKVSSNPDRAGSSGRTLITIPKAAAVHNGGQLAFGPDGYLYLSVGDGGGVDLQLDNAQDLGTLRGKLLRIDVNAPWPYAIPPDNPFRTVSGARREIWALGLRNLWRYSFDRSTGELYLADVGQDRWEEVNVAQDGVGAQNYGWPIMEGSTCNDPPVGCDAGGLTLPVFQYDHSQGCSITGGYVYRGSTMPSFLGTYFYSDFCAGWLRSFRLVGGTPTDHQEWDVGDLGGVLSFGEDGRGELFILSTNGSVYRLIETA
ncbi:MAG TPA: PQQ-dependent sugar dehydrogenase [Thermoanaerobaculia bacterium]|nr:PQQ-dependent sugar dehydrogenase [Thermoanaerobaculia bacterium]